MVILIYAALFAGAFALMRWEHRESIAKAEDGPDLEVADSTSAHLYGRFLRSGRTIRDMQRAVHANSVRKGFYDGTDTPSVELVSMRLALIHSEISEALEDIRKAGIGELRSYLDEKGKPCGFGSEIADAVIRCMDMAEWLGIDLQDEIERKHNFNVTRPVRHGKVF